jgi:hypothetical protein
MVSDKVIMANSALPSRMKTATLSRSNKKKKNVGRALLAMITLSETIGFS